MAAEYFSRNFYESFLAGSDEIYSFYDSSAVISRLLLDKNITGNLNEMEKNLSVDNAVKLYLIKSVDVPLPDGKKLISTNGFLQISDGKKLYFNHHIIVKLEPSIKIFVDTLNVSDVEQDMKAPTLWECSKPAPKQQQQTSQTSSTQQQTNQTNRDRNQNANRQNRNTHQRGRGGYQNKQTSNRQNSQNQRKDQKPLTVKDFEPYRP